MKNGVVLREHGRSDPQILGTLYANQSLRTELKETPESLSDKIVH